MFGNNTLKLFYSKRFFRILLVSIFALSFSVNAYAWDDWDDWGDDEPSVSRPFVSGWWNWQYNSFSSYDQLRVNFDHDFSRNSRILFGFNFNHYTEENNKKWDLFAGENYYFFRDGDFDFRIGNLIENIGSGDNFSFVDKINSRRFINGLANDFDRDKKEMPGVRMNWFFAEDWQFSANYMPYFKASEFPSMFSQWSYAIQRSLAMEVLLNKANYDAPEDSGFRPQFQAQISTYQPSFELNLHYMRLRERLPVISKTGPNSLQGSYPIDETFAINGSVDISSELIMRYEVAYSRNRTMSSYVNGIIGEKFQTDHWGILMGVDRNLPQNFYINIQGLISHMPDLQTQTPLQLKETEYMTTFQLRQTFRRDRLAFEFNGLINLSTGEQLLTPQVHIEQSDFLTFVAGIQINSEGAENFGPIGQFAHNNTAFFESRVSF